MYGLVLEGGGAKGAYHVGAYKALKELNIEIGGIAGTSIGALNGAFLIQGEVEDLEKIWINTKTTDIFSLDEKAEKIISDLKNFNLKEINLPYLLNTSKEIINNGGLDTSKIRALLEEIIDEEKIRNSNMDFGIVTVNLTDRKPMEIFKEDIPKGRLIEYLLASANLPAFKQDELDGKKFLDGGFHNNLPIGILAKKGYTNIIAVRTHAIGIVRRPKKWGINIIYIQPVEQLAGILDFNKQQAERDMNLGYYDTMKVFKKLRGYKYYCEAYDGNFNQLMVDFLIEKKDRILKIGNILGFSDIPPDRMLYEKIMPRLENILDMKGNHDYQDIFIRLVEQIAEKYNDVEKFKIYKAKDFWNTVINKFKSQPIEYTKNVPSFIKHNKILSLAVKESLIIEIFEEMFL
ncbi:MAG: patatin-like phospholipase family protein [Tissierellia bacterium]|nr:patatin-like phospholipase family protein [Tissierellia bacterium]